MTSNEFMVECENHMQGLGLVFPRDPQITVHRRNDHTQFEFKNGDVAQTVVIGATTGTSDQEKFLHDLAQNGRTDLPWSWASQQ